MEKRETNGPRERELVKTECALVVVGISSWLSWVVRPQHVTSTPSLCLFSKVTSRLSSSGVHSHVTFTPTFVVTAQ